MRRNSDKIDKAFTNRAWTDMRQLLDREMPTKERRRFPLWWWAGGSTAVLLTALLVWGLAWQIPFPQKALPKENNPLEKAPAPAPAGDILPSTPVASVQVPQPAKLSDLRSAMEKTALAAPAQPTSIAKGEGNYEPQAASAAPLAELPRQPMAKLESKVANPALAALLPLPLPPIQPASIRDAAPIPMLSASNQIPGFRTLTFGVHGMYAQRTDGLGMDISRAFRLGNSRWSLSLGAGYTYLRRELFLLTADSIGQGIPVTFLETNVNYAFQQFQENVFSEALSITHRRQDIGLHYLELPLTLQWSGTSRFGLRVGVLPALLLAAAPDRASGGLLDHALRNTKAKSSQNMLQGRSKLVPVNNFDFQARGGISYRLTPQLEMALDYHHGLSDVLPDNAVKDRHRSWRLTLYLRPKDH